MAFTVQNNDGTAAGANAYIDVAYFKSHHDDRGNDYGTATNAAIQQAIVKATDYVDTRYRFKGWRRNRDQTTEWPRGNVYDETGNRGILDFSGWLVEDIPEAVKQATAELALRAVNGTDLLPDPTHPDAGHPVQSESVNVGGAVTKSTTYAVGKGGARVPSFPKVDGILRMAGLLVGGGQATRIVRG